MFSWNKKININKNCIPVICLQSFLKNNEISFQKINKELIKVGAETNEIANKQQNNGQLHPQKTRVGLGKTNDRTYKPQAKPFTREGVSKISNVTKENDASLNKSCPRKMIRKCHKQVVCQQT